MNRDETKALMAVIKAAYPSFYRNENLTEAIKLWEMMFSDDDANAVAAAVKSWIASDVKGFPPVIGQIKGMLYKIQQPERMTELEAWGLVLKAARRSICYAAEEHAKLPELIKQMVTPAQLRDWGMSDEDSLSVHGSNFMRSYRAKAHQAEEFAKLPGEVRQMLGSFSGKLLEVGDEQQK